MSLVNGFAIKSELSFLNNGRNLEESILSCRFTDEEIISVANTRLGLYRQAYGHVVNFLLSPKILAIKKKDRPGLVNPLNYYQS